MADESFELADRTAAAEAIWRMSEEDLRFLKWGSVEAVRAGPALP